MLEEIWNVVVGLLNNGQPVTFETIYTNMPEAMKVKTDPRPNEAKMADWKFAEHFPDWRRLIKEKKYIFRSMFETHPPNLQVMGS